MGDDVTITVTSWDRWPVERPSGHKIVFTAVIARGVGSAASEYTVPFDAAAGMAPRDVLDYAFQRVQDDLTSQVVALKARAALVGSTYTPPVRTRGT